MDASEAATEPAEGPEHEPPVDPAPDPSLVVPPPPAGPGEVPTLAESLPAQTRRNLAVIVLLLVAAGIVAALILTADDEMTIATTTTTATTLQAAVETGPADLAAAAVVDHLRPAQKAVNGNLRSIRLTAPRLARLRNAALYLAIAVAEARALLPTVADAGHRDALRNALGAEEAFADALLALPGQPGQVTPRHARTVRDTAARARGAWSRVAAIPGVTMLPIGPAWANPLVRHAEGAARARALDGAGVAGSLAAVHARAVARARAAAASAAAAARAPAFSATAPGSGARGTSTISSPTHASHCRFYARIPYSTSGESGVVCTSSSGPKLGYAALLTATGSTWLGQSDRRWSLDGGSVLPYGSATSKYGITCSSSRTALSCSGAGSGISIAKESHTSW